MPEVKLNAAELGPRCCNSSANGWPETPAGSARAGASATTPPTHRRSCADHGGGLSYLPSGDDGESLFGPDPAGDA